MSALARVLAASVLNVCLLHALPAAAAQHLPRTAAAAPVDGCRKQLSADIVFLVDTSGSILPEDYEKIREFLKHFVNSFEIGPKEFSIGVVTYDQAVYNEFWLNTHTAKSSLLEAIDRIQFHSFSTRTDLGLEFVRQEAFTEAHGDHEDANNILIVVTDGESDHETLTADEANKLHKTGIKVLAIGVGRADQKELRTIASDEESVFVVTNFDALKAIEEELKNTACEAAAAGCGKRLPVDIVFLLDSSGSIYIGDFNEVKEFFKRFVKSVQIGPKDFNIGAVTFANVPHNVFWLNNHTTKSPLLEAIDKMNFTKGETIIHLALEFVRQEAFTKAHGDREDANNILIVVTDGKSDHETLTADEANKLHKTGIKVLAIGVGRADQKELRTIASDEESVFGFTSIRELKSIEERFKNTVCKAADAPVDDNEE